MKRLEVAMDKLATYTGKDARMNALDAKLMNGGSLSAKDVDEVIRFFRWDNMAKGN